MSDEKPREWWVAQIIPENGGPVFYAAYIGRPAQDSWVGEIYRVIERCAYEAAAEKCLALALKYDAAADRVLAAEKERNHLKRALENIKDTCEETGLSLDASDLRVDVDNIHEIAREALEPKTLEQVAQETVDVAKDLYADGRTVPIKRRP